MSQPIWIIGVGAEGPASLPTGLQTEIEQADQLWGSRRLLAYWADHPASQVVISGQIADLVERARQRGPERIVILASGDPGFYGIAATLLRALPAADLKIVPHVTALQLAFARAGLAWHDAVFSSAHARPLAEVMGWARRAPKLGILTDHKQTPALIAQKLLAAGLADCRAIVAENLGLPDEHLTDTRLSALPGREFSALNVLLLIQDPGWRPRPVLAPRPDEAYVHRRGLITKADVRTLSLARLALSENDVAWDIGAGSGAMSLEMAELAWRGQVFAIEQDPENLAFIRQNVERFGAYNLTLIADRAPAALADLPQPAAVFIGGTGGEMTAIVREVARLAQPGSSIVANLATLENLHQLLELMTSLGWSPQVTQVSLAYGQAIAGLTRLAPLNPVFIVSGQMG